MRYDLLEKPDFTMVQVTFDQQGEQMVCESSAMVDVFAAGTRGRSFSLPGGGRVHLDPDSMVEVVAVSDARVQLSLLRGGATFEPSSLPIEVVAGETARARFEVP